MVYLLSLSPFPRLLHLVQPSALCPISIMNALISSQKHSTIVSRLPSQLLFVLRVLLFLNNWPLLGHDDVCTSEKETGQVFRLLFGTCCGGPCAQKSPLKKHPPLQNSLRMREVWGDGDIMAVTPRPRDEKAEHAMAKDVEMRYGRH